MEEDIKLLENFCEVFRMTQRSMDKYEREEYGEIIGQDEIQAIENLIAKNKELEYKLREHICIEAHEQVKQLYIPKSKVREKIEEIKKDENPSISSFQEYAQEYSIKKLQELLEERN